MSVQPRTIRSAPPAEVRGRLTIGGPPRTAERRILLWQRWALILATLLVVTASAPTVGWAAVVSLPVLCSALAVPMFRSGTLARWLARGGLFAADATLVGLALVGTARPRVAAFLVLSGVLLAAVFTGCRLRTVLAGLAGGALVVTLALSGALAGVELTLLDAVFLPLLLTAALHFGYLAEWLGGKARDTEIARREREELWAVTDITDTVTSSLDVTEVMHAIVERVGDMLDTPSCSILLAINDSPDCFVVASKGHPEANMMGLDLVKYPEIRQALTTRQIVVIDDIASHPLVASVRDVLLAKGYRSLLVVPLLFGKEVLGTLFLKSRRDRPFSAEELRFCQVAASVSANAVKNALLYRDVRLESARHRETGDKLRSVLDSTPDLIAATDVDGRVTEFNRGAEELSGWSASSAVGQDLREVLGLPDEAGTALVDDPEPRDVRVRRIDGSTREVSLIRTRLSGPEGAHSGWVWIGRDVSKLRRAERSLAQAERLSSLGGIVAGVAHELNNPLSGVVGYAELLRANAGDPAQIRDLERIVESALRCQKIVYNLLSFARKHAPEKRLSDLNECVRKVLDLKAYQLQALQLHTVLELDPDLPQTSFDFHQIEQVILNLLNNAEHVLSERRSQGTITLRTGTSGRGVFVEVEDDGPGVPEEAREHVFDPFFTTKDIGQGTGLGLSVSYGIVQEHGGRIELDNEYEGGARFRVWLPLVEGDPEPVGTVASEQPQAVSALRGTRILVAEDEPLVLELLFRVLSEVGAEVTLAHDGLEAWNRLEGAEFDLVVADLRMPNLSGQQLYERIAEERPELLRRLVFATGDLVRQESVSFLHGLPNRILTKPLEVETVRRVLAQALEAVA